ncbi:MAG: hypothetical protein OJF49_003453 [Ktedonobacterales bacterium]|jgi:hypothetical protein|nr:MAG: hypothetical protein OJF49_003453 [Ktedonobacterales bacterium]
MDTRPTSLLAEETPDEALLRQTFSEHAPVTVDTEKGWNAIAPQVAAIASEGSMHTRRGILPWRRTHGAETAHAPRSRKRAIAPWAAVGLVAALLLTGAGFAGIFTGFPFNTPKLRIIGDEHLYTDVNQTQQADGVTIKVYKAYADPGNTYIAYSIQMSPELAKLYTYTTIGSWSITGQDGEATLRGNIVCSAAKPGDEQFCVMDEGPYHPAPGTSQLTITWDITAVYLNNTSPGYTTLSGPWHFQFTIPFHAKNLGAGGPYAQPTR